MVTRSRNGAFDKGEGVGGGVGIPTRNQKLELTSKWNCF